MERAQHIYNRLELEVLEITRWETSDSTEFDSTRAAHVYQAFLACEGDRKLFAEVLRVMSHSESWD